MNRCFLFFGVRTENVETPEQRVAAVEQQELQQEQDEGRSDQVLELFVELLEAEGRQVAFFHIVDRAYDFVQPDRLVGRADVGSVGRLCDLFEQGFAQFRYDHLSLVVLDELDGLEDGLERLAVVIPVDRQAEHLAHDLRDDEDREIFLL